MNAKNIETAVETAVEEAPEETVEEASGTTKIVLPLPLPMSLHIVAQKDGSKPSPRPATLRSNAGPFVTLRNGEEKRTKSTGNTGHNLPLNRAEFEFMTGVLATLRLPKEDASRIALIAAIREDGGIVLPTGTSGRKGSEGEDVSDAFADLNI